MKALKWVSLGLVLAGSAACSDDTPVEVEEPAADSATYMLTFRSAWSRTTHPDGFPPGPHFSGLIGATHGSGYTMWAAGQLASTGIKDMAELGAKGALTSEVDAAIQAGTAGRVVSGAGIALSPGIANVTFDVDSRYTLLSVTSMIAPSPDWFVGIAGLDLRPGGVWIDSMTVSLSAYDAGTDSGASYTSPNAATTPQAAISRLTEMPFQAGSPPLGTFTIVRR